MMEVQFKMKKSLIIKLSLVITFVIIAIVGIIMMTNAMRCVPPCVQMKEELTAHEKATMTWRWTALIIYLMICFYDFMFVPIWYGLNRPDISLFMEIINSTEEPMVQMELMKKLTGQHNPFTLMGGGLFHLAFGAILTGSAFASKRQQLSLGI